MYYAANSQASKGFFFPSTTIASVPETCDMLLRMGNDAFLFKISDTVPVMDMLRKKNAA